MLISDCSELSGKIDKAIRLIKSVCAMHHFTLAFSGGKDSVVLDYLCREAGVRVPLVYSSTTIDPVGTIPWVLKHGAYIIRPELSFLDLIERKGLPSMFRRFCCAYLKERYIDNYVFMGVRADESVKRRLRYDSYEMCRRYPHGLKSHALFPILDFSFSDIRDICLRHGIEQHPLYYDTDGVFHAERRLGCIGCPLQSDRGRADYRQYPKLLRQVVRRLLRYCHSHGRSEHDAYLMVVYQLFYSNHKSKLFEQTYHGLFTQDPKSFLEDYFSVSLDF